MPVSCLPVSGFLTLRAFAMRLPSLPQQIKTRKTVSAHAQPTLETVFPENTRSLVQMLAADPAAARSSTPCRHEFDSVRKHVAVG